MSCKENRQSDRCPTGSRELKFGEALPGHIRTSIETHLANSRQQNLARLNRMKKLLRSVKASGTMEDTQNELNKYAPAWVKKVQGHIDFVFIDKVAKIFQINEVGNESWREYWRKGVPVNTEDVPLSGAFEKRDKPKRSAPRRADSWKNHPIKLPVKPFKFMKDYNLKRAWNDFEKRNGKNVKEVQSTNLKSCPILSFGVEQGEYVIVEGVKWFKKLRSCLDFREPNAYCDQTEIMKLNGIPVVSAAVAAMISGDPEVITPVKQTKKDVNTDVERELRNDFEFRLTESPEKENPGRFRGRRVLIAKRDKKSYYHQFGVRDPQMVTYAFWDEDQKRWRFFEAECLDFGSIHAIWFPVRVAAVNEKILNALGIPCVVYIDDTILICDEEVMKEQEELCDLYYELAGFKMSAEKDESMMNLETVKVLGIEFSKGTQRNEIVLSIPQVKLSEAETCAGDLKTALRNKEASEKLFEKLHGKAIFCTSLKAMPGQGFVRQLAVWASRAEFYGMLNKGMIRHLILCVMEVEKVLKSVRPVKISPLSLTRQVVKMTSDAAAPEEPMLGGMLANGRFAWTVKWTRIAERDFWRCCQSTRRVGSHIGIWELMAVALNITILEKDLKKKKSYIFVDNLGDVRILVKLTSKCPVCQAIAAFIGSCLERIDNDPYYVYINTERNPSDALTRLDKFESIFEAFPDLIVIDLAKDRFFQGVAKDLIAGVLGWICRFEAK